MSGPTVWEEAMQVRVLGPVDVVDDDGSNVGLGGPTQNKLLAVLAARGHRPVAVDDLVADLWVGADLPADPVASLRTYVARIRAAMGAEAVITGTGSYKLGAIDTDASRFEALVERARRSSGSPAAGELWKHALGAWRGMAFGEHAELHLVRPEATRLEELRAEATEAWIDARLAAGEGRELAADVDAAVDEFPLREGFRAQQMTVLARAGRQAEALRAFQQFRADLTEVGLEPSERLQDLDREIAAGGTPRSRARRTLRGYELGDRLGEGAFAIVHRATQTSVGRSVAIKQIRTTLADQPDFIRQFEAEAYLVARLEHPHIVPLYDFWREPGSAYLVMRYLDGGSLAAALLEGPLHLESLVPIVGQVATALDAAHGAGVIHRDVKPGNVLLDAPGNAYLSDFGIAVEEAERLDPEAWLSNGSPAYAPPEQLRRQAVGPEADVYALGVTTYEGLTGHLPFPAETTMAGLLERQLNDPIPLVRSWVPDIPSAVDTVIQRATAKDPADRYRSAGEFAIDLAAAAGLEGEQELIQPEDRNPYKGLRAFDEADASDFAGRERLVAQLVDVVEEHRAVVVVGPSGSGKSSVVRAGLLPAIRRGRVTDSSSWLVAHMVPGTDPYSDLEAALLSVAVDNPVDLRAQLTADGRGLAQLVRRVLPRGRQVLLVIDQLEELFTQPGNEKVAARFLDSLVVALTEEDPRVRVVATLRADFYDHPLRHPAFAQLIRPGTVPVHPLAADELERAITDPARAIGASFEAGLVAEISAAVADQPGALPLLQYALTELYEHRDGRTMTRDAYKDLGGVSGALARRAEELFIASSSTEQDAVARLMTRLVQLGDGTEDTRRRVPRSELASDPATAATIDRYTAARLLSLDRDPTTREPTVEVAHEALIREWPRLRTWIEDDRDGLRILHHLTDNAAAWDDRGRDDADLYRGARLEAALEWQAANTEQLSQAECDFLAAGRQLRDHELVAERKRVRRLRGLLAGVGIVAVLALLAGGLAFVQRGRANDERARATENARIAEENATEADRQAVEADEQRDLATQRAEEAELSALIARSAVEAPTRPEVGLLLAVEAFERYQGPASQRALLTALGAVPNRVRTVSGAAGFTNPDCLTTAEPGRYIGGQNPVVLLDADGDTRVLPIDAGCSAVESPDRTRIAYDGPPTGLTVADAQTGETISTSLNGEVVNTIAWSPDGTTVAAGVGVNVNGNSLTETINLADAATGEVIDSLVLPSFARHFEWLPDGRFVHDLLTEPDGRAPEAMILLTDGPGGEVLGSYGPSGDPITAVAVRPDLDLIAAADFTGTIRAWQLGSAELIAEIDTGGVEVQDLSLVGASAVVVATGDSVIEFDLFSGRQTSEVGSFAGVVRAVDELPDGTLAVLTERGEILVIDPSSDNLSTDSLVCCPFGQGTTMAVDNALATAFNQRGGDFVTDHVIIDVATGTATTVDPAELGLDDPGPILAAPGGRAVVWDSDGEIVYLDREGTETDRLDPYGDTPAVVVSGSRSGNHFINLVVVGDLDAVAPTGFVVRDLETGDQLGDLIPYDLEDRVIRWGSLPDGTFIGTTTSGHIWRWDLNAERAAEPLATDAAGSMFTSSEHWFVGYASLEGDLVVIDARTGDRRYVGPGLGGATIPIVSTDGTRLVLLDFDGRAVLHDLERGAEIGPLTGTGSGPTRAQPVFAPDGDAVWLATGDSWRRYPLDPVWWRNRACQLAGRELTDEEWAEFVSGDEPRRTICQ